MSGDTVKCGGQVRPDAEDLSAKLAGLAELESSALRRAWRRLDHSNPPPRVRRDLLVLAIAWKLQEKAYGGLTAAQKRKLAALSEDLRKGGDLRACASVRVKPGAKLVREWGGETHTVLVLEEGFEWNGKRRRSLSEIAREITGTRWSGPRLFGLRRRATPVRAKEPSNA